MTTLTSNQFGDIECHKGERSIVYAVILLGLFVITAIIIGVFAIKGFAQETNAYALSCALNACDSTFLTPMPTPTTAPVKPSPTPQVNASKSISWTGKVSHYSRAGCLGCSATLTMANGEPLDDSRPTIAFNNLPMNSQVKITNLDNGKSMVATVTDTGGFKKLGRIADLVPAVANELETKTDVTNVLIEEL